MKRTILALTIVGLAAVACYALWPSETAVRPGRTSAAASTPPAIDRDEPRARAAAPQPAGPIETVSVAVAPPPPSIPLDEPALMSTLRDLGDSSPQYSLQVAREGNLRFPDSADAAERAWYVCKSLVNLENFYDAREEARVMVAKYPGTPWALDVARHLLTNPLDLPGDPAPQGG